MKKIINFRPCLILAIGIALSITAALTFILNLPVVGAIIIAVILALLVWFFIYEKKKDKLKFFLIFASVFLAVSVIASTIFSFQIINYKNENLHGMVYTVNGRVVNVSETSYGKMLEVNDVELSGVKKGKTGYGIAVYVYGECNYEIGDKINFTSSVYDKDIIYEGKVNGSAIESKIKYFANVLPQDITVTGNNKTLFEIVNNAFKSVLQKGMGKQEFGVAYAMLCGNSDYIDSDVLSAYRDAGVAHVFAVSGLHIGIFAAVLAFLFKKTKYFIKMPIILFILLFYSGVCGFSASSLRALIMAIVLLTAKNFGKKYDPLSSVSLAAIIILLFNPVQLLCLGFELSFAVVYGIVLLSKPIAKLFKFLPKKFALSIGTVLSSQIFGAPVFLIAFGKVSLISVMVNLLFLPIIGFVFIFLLFSTILACIIAPEILLPVSYILTGFNYVITAFDLSIFSVGGITVSGLILFYYGGLILTSGIINLRRILLTVLSISLMVVFVLTCTVYNLVLSTKTKVQITGSESFCAVTVSGKENSLIVAYAKEDFNTNKLLRLYYGTSQKTDNLFILNSDKDVDAYGVVTRINTVIKFRSVYMAEEISEDINLLKKIFPTVDFYTVKENQKVTVGENEFTFYGKNCFAHVKTPNSVGLIFSYLGGKSKYSLAPKVNYDYSVCIDHAREIDAYYKAKDKINFYLDNGYKNAYSQGKLEFIY